MLAEIFKTNWIELIDVFTRSILSLVILFLITKLLGKKQVSQLSLFDYVIGISIGNFAAEMSINLDSQIVNGIFAVIIFGVIAYLISIGTMKSILLRRYFMGSPTIIIEDGVLLEKGLRKVHFDINDLLEECRGAGYFDLSDIKFAIMEANGKISILPKDGKRAVTISDMNLKIKVESLCANIIIDGNIMQKNLENSGKNVTWIQHQLKIKRKKLEHILLATLDCNEKMVIYEKNKDRKSKDILE